MAVYVKRQTSRPRGGIRRRQGAKTASSKQVKTKKLNAWMDKGFSALSGWRLDLRALWSAVGHGCETRELSKIQAQGGARSMRRDAFEIASSEPLKAYKAIQGISEPLNTSEQVQGNTYTRLTRQSHRCLDEPDYKAKPEMLR